MVQEESQTLPTVPDQEALYRENFLQVTAPAFVSNLDPIGHLEGYFDPYWRGSMPALTSARESASSTPESAVLAALRNGRRGVEYNAPSIDEPLAEWHILSKHLAIQEAIHAWLPTDIADLSKAQSNLRAIYNQIHEKETMARTVTLTREMELIVAEQLARLRGLRDILMRQVISEARPSKTSNIRQPQTHRRFTVTDILEGDLDPMEPCL